jgi:hypothetical protein
VRFQKTEALWPALSQAFALVQQAAHVLANHEEESGQAVREHYQAVLRTMREQQASLGPLSSAISTFLKVTRSYWPGLFQCYDVADLPRTDNELEHCFGSVRYGSRDAPRDEGGDCGVGGTRAGSGADGLGLAAAVLLTARALSARS